MALIVSVLDTFVYVKHNTDWKTDWKYQYSSIYQVCGTHLNMASGAILFYELHKKSGVTRNFELIMLERRLSLKLWIITNRFFSWGNCELWHCHSRKSTGVRNEMNNGWNFADSVSYLRYCAFLKRIKPLLMLRVLQKTMIPLLLWKKGLG